MGSFLLRNFPLGWIFLNYHKEDFFPIIDPPWAILPFP